MKKYLILIAFFPLIIGSQCNNKDDECHKAVMFYNNDTIDVYVLSYFDTTFYQHYAMPGEKVVAKSKNNNAISLRDCFEYRIPIEKPPYLGIIVTNAKLVDDSTWDYVSNHKLFLKQYSFSLEDLQRMNWTVTYPQ